MGTLAVGFMARSFGRYWSVVTRYNDQIVRPLTGENPASGVYPVNAPNNDQTVVMTFEITPAQAAAARAARLKTQQGTFTPTPLSEMDLWKLELLEEGDF